MRGVRFGDLHTATDWDLVLSEKKLNPPTPKHITVEVDGRDGDLDLSEALTGEIKYNNREASYTLLALGGTPETREERFNEIINYLHGKRKEIIDPDDPDYYLVGRCTVGEVTNIKGYGSIVITAICEPYRYSTIEMIRTFTLTETPTDIILTNVGTKTIVPTITVTGGNVTLVFDSTSVSLSDGAYKLAELRIPKGSKTVTISGTGKVVFTYREAVL